jgi:uncharacterized phage infection (PIP) family protein YhgE
MSVVELMQKVVGSRKERQQAAIENYRGLVRGIGDGIEPNADEVDEALERAGKKPEDLQADAELYIKRKALQAHHATLPELESERTKLRDELAAVNAAFVEQELAHKRKSFPLFGQIEVLDTKIQAAEQSLRSLRNTYAGPLLDDLARLEKESAALTQQMRAIEKVRDQHAADLGCRRTRHQCLTEGDKKSLRAAITAADAQIAELQRQRAVIEQRQAEVEKEMLVP